MAASEEVAPALIGVGGGGVRMLDGIVSGLGVSAACIAMHRDARTLRKSKAACPIRLDAPKGLEGEIDDAVGRAWPCIRQAMGGAGIAVLLATLGGRTGTFAAPALACRLAEAGIKIWTVAVLPFAFEGDERRRLAEAAASRLASCSEHCVKIENQKLIAGAHGGMSMLASFRQVDAEALAWVLARWQAYAQAG